MSKKMFNLVVGIVGGVAAIASAVVTHAAGLCRPDCRCHRHRVYGSNRSLLTLR